MQQHSVQFLQKPNIEITNIFLDLHKLKLEVISMLLSIKHFIVGQKLLKVERKTRKTKFITL